MMTTIQQELIEQGIQQGIERGIEQGIEQGHLEAQRKIARKLLTQHDPLTVSEITGLSLAEVQALQDDKQSS